MNGNNFINLKKGVFTQQQLFRVISVVKIKGQLITGEIMYLYIDISDITTLHIKKKAYIATLKNNCN